MSNKLKASLKVSVIVTTYNWPEALSAVLLALEDQTYRDFEVIIADDGSGPATQKVIEEFQAKSNLHIQWVWQEDEGFQAAKIRNKAAALASGAYLIFLDGDSLPRPSFIESHLQLATPGWFAVGRRVLLNTTFTQEVLHHKIPVHRFSYLEWTKVFSKGAINKTKALWNLPLGPLRRLHANEWRGAMTCNLGVWREDFLAVNGFDESFIGWGYEDSEFVIRLLRSGVRRLSAKYKSAVIHLWHPEHTRTYLKENFERFYKSAIDYSICAQKGIRQYLQDSSESREKFPLSVVMITLNEAKKIRASLESVSWAQEIIILDSGSTDETLTIAREYTDLIEKTDWPGFGIQKNRALNKATQPWVLSLDADEVLSQALQSEIKTLLRADPSNTAYPLSNAYQIRRESIFMGKKIHHGDWANDWVTRLFQINHAQFNQASVHEALCVKGSTGRLQKTMAHYAIDRIEQSLNKLNQYSTLSAQTHQDRGKKTSILGAWGRSKWTFLRGYLFKLGFLDGRAGYLIAKLNSEGTFYKYIKACYLHEITQSKRKMQIKELRQKGTPS